MAVYDLKILFCSCPL